MDPWIFFFLVYFKSMFSHGLRFAPLDEAWKDTGIQISPKFENPYRSGPTPVDSVDKRDITQKYISRVYESEGVSGVVRLLEPEVVRDIQSLYKQKPKPAAMTVSMDDMIFIGIAILLFMYIASD